MSLIIPLNEQNPLAKKLAQLLKGELAEVTLRSFPDGESYVRVQMPCKDQDSIIVASLHQPNDKLLPILFLSETLRDLGVKSVGLVCPYLAYMRQDRRFHEGEGITSKYFAKLISQYFDWLVTIDPHLHRYHSLSEIYSIPTQIVHAAPLISEWIHQHVKQPLLVGPDSESEQWVADVAKKAKAPHVVLNKVRHGDRDVEVSVPEVEKWKDHTPVLVDDIISTGRTMIETIGHLKKANMKAPVCIGVHGIFADQSYQELINAGVTSVITCNSIPHTSNKIDLVEIIGSSIHKLNIE